MFRPDEIRKIWVKFYRLAEKANTVYMNVPKSQNQGADDIDVRVPATTVLNMEELVNNPFKYRIVRHFSKSAKLSENLVPTFEQRKELSVATQLKSFCEDQANYSKLWFEFDDFIQMFSAFSTR